MKFLEQTVEPKALTLVDWIAIATALEREPSWGFYRWMEISGVDKSSLSLEDWEAIAAQIQYDQGWAYWRYKENRKTA